MSHDGHPPIPRCAHLGLIVVLLAACRPSPRDDADTDTPTDPTDTDADSDPVPLPDACSSTTPDGWCPGTSACVDGLCRVDLDPGVPAPAGAASDWEAIAAYIGTRSQLLDSRPVDWSAISADGQTTVAAATTEFAAAWAMMRAADRLRDGHTFVRAPAVCAADPGFSSRQSNAGACLVESAGRLVVATTVAGSPWRGGDILLDIDGRDAEALIADRLAQPRCDIWASTDAGARERAVASLLMRQAGELQVRVRRGADELVFPLPDRSYLACPGRIGVAGEEVLIANVRHATLPGGVELIVLPQMGVTVGDDFVVTPLLDALRAHLNGLPPATPIVLDLRGNYGGATDIASVFGAWLLPTDTELWRCANRRGDAPEAISEMIPRLAADDPLNLDGPVAVITDGGTYGSAEFLPWLVQATGRGITVGSPTNGSFGMAWPIPIGSWGAAVNALRCERPDGRVLDGDPPPVDLPVSLLPEDAAAGVDTVIEAARVAVLGGTSP